jgi:SAM-dependent methyltransferase
MACGLVMQNPMPTERFLKRFYSSRTYFGLCHGVLWPSEPAVSKGSEAGRVNAGFFAEVAALGIVRPGDGFRLLDVGAGTLHFLAGVRRDFPSIRAYALEPGAAFAKPRRQILDGSYKDIDSLPDGTSFDVITAWHVLEHLREPVRALKRLKRNLKPGGWLLLEVPDFGKYAWAPEWRKLHHLGHQYHFTRLTLRRTLEAAGFRDIGFCDRRLQHEVGVKAIAKA